MLVSLTVGKVDAGVAVLLTEDKRLIEFPSILLPPSITSGSIVDITVSQNHEAEHKSQASFAALQSSILNTYGIHTPATPVLRLRNATQTSLVLEWDPIQLATCTLRSLALYRDGNKAGNIPRPMEMLSTKISGLQVDTEHSFYLVLRTSGGTYTSNTITVKTHAMSNLTGITVTPGILPAQLRQSLESAVERIGAKIVDTIRIDTTHFVCTEGRGRDWERANEMNIPVVRPEWIEGCEREGRLIGVRGYYLDANPKHRQIGSNPAFNTSQTAAPEEANPTTTLPQRTVKESTEEDSTVSGEPGPEISPDLDKSTPPTPKVEQGEEDEEEEEEPAAEEEEDDEEEDEEVDKSKSAHKADLETSDVKVPERVGTNASMEDVAL